MLMYQLCKEYLSDRNNVMINRRGVYVFSFWCWNFRLLNERWNILVQKKRTYTTCLFPKNLKKSLAKWSPLCSAWR